MYARSAAIYDALFSSKDYAGEAEKIHALIQQHKLSPGSVLLDVACGTGGHLPYLRAYYTIEGLDNEQAMLALARQRQPDLPFHQADMADFDLGRQFDALICLFSSIGYVKTLERLRQTLKTFCRHTAPGGVVIVEPWFRPHQWQAGLFGTDVMRQPDFKAVRMWYSLREGNLSMMDEHYLVASSAGIEHFTERQELGLFAHEEYLAAFQEAGMAVTYDPAGLIGQGLYIGVADE